MEYEPVPFLGMFSYGISVKRPLEHRHIAVLDFRTIEEMPDSQQLGEITAYLCGAGMRRQVYNLQGYNHGENQELAAKIASNTKHFAIYQKYVGVEADKISNRRETLAERWKEHLHKNSAPSIEKAIEDLLAEQEASGLPL